jgi:three-Cys-motif partner protein
MNMNVLWKNPDKVSPAQIARMDAYWGDNSWRNVLYKKSRGLLPDFDLEDKASNDAVAAAYRDRLKKVAGFKYVPEPMPMRNTRGAIVYYLFFASPNKTGAKIVGHIFNKYRNTGTT